MSAFEIQGFQGDAAGQLTGRRVNELLISLTRDGMPILLSASNFIVTPMLPGLLGAKVVSVYDYGHGGHGLQLAQHAYVHAGHPLPGANWPNGVLLFNVDAVFYLPGEYREGCGLATAVIQDPPLVQTTIDRPHSHWLDRAIASRNIPPYP